jgi:pyruvate/2-oxoacid:ferredoxin oxidoreductase alpha subunit
MDIMQEKWRYCLWGAAGGAAALAMVGFTWGGWMTANAAGQFARKEANAAVVKVLTPFCVTNFQKAVDAADKLVALKKISSSWQRETFVKEGKWAIIGTEQDSGVVDACAEALFKL